MFQRIAQYRLMETDSGWYRPRAYGDQQPDGTWGGWLVFFRLGGPAVATGRETTQTTLGALVDWASSLSDVYLEGALARALRIAQQPPLVDQLAAAEYEALDDAERLETAARIERAAAEVDEAAAAAARTEAERIRDERLATEDALEAMEAAAEEAAEEAAEAAAEAATGEATEEAARLEAEALEQAARDARIVADDIARRRQDAEGASRSKHPKRRGAGKQ